MCGYVVKSDCGYSSDYSQHRSGCGYSSDYSRYRSVFSPTSCGGGCGGSISACSGGC